MKTQSFIPFNNVKTKPTKIYKKTSLLYIFFFKNMCISTTQPKAYEREKISM